MCFSVFFMCIYVFIIVVMLYCKYVLCTVMWFECCDVICWLSSDLVELWEWFQWVTIGILGVECISWIIFDWYWLLLGINDCKYIHYDILTNILLSYRLKC